MGASVPLEVKGVIKALSAKGAKVALDIAVTLHMAIEEALELESLGADATLVEGRVALRSQRW